MTTGRLTKLLFILATIVFSILMILPTIGKNELKIVLKDGIEENNEEYQKILKRFPDDTYSIIKDEKIKNIIYIRGYNLNDAVMNEVRTFPIVKEAEFMPHFIPFAKKINLGLDLQGGMLIVMQADYVTLEKKLKANLKGEKKENFKLSDQDKKDITEQAIESITRRIEKEVAEPSIRPRGTDAIEIQLPGVKDPERVKRIIRKTGRVEYRLVDDTYTAKVDEYVRNNPELTKDGITHFPAKYQERKDLRLKISNELKIPEDLELLYAFEMDQKNNVKYPSRLLALQRKVSLGGNDFQSAIIAPDEYQRISVHITTTSDGAKKFADVTSSVNKNKALAIVIDDEIVSYPRINDRITTGKAVITGSFSQEEAKILVRVIKEGALPVSLNIIEERTVGPSLGNDSIEAGIRAILIGLILVLTFMIIWYRGAGIIADICLVLNLVIVLALLSWTGATLTLPGIAGLILTVGMSVDANVIIYERIKEEIRNGKSVKVSVRHGFERAFWTIFDANLTTLIAGFILYQVGTGPIKGFAVTLIIGIISSMFVALFVAKFIYEVLTNTFKMKKLSI